MNTCQEDKGNAVLTTEGTPNSNNKTVHFSYKGEWMMHSNTFKKKSSLQLHSSNLSLKQLSTIVKKVHY